MFCAAEKLSAAQFLLSGSKVRKHIFLKNVFAARNFFLTEGFSILYNSYRIRRNASIHVC